MRFKKHQKIKTDSGRFSCICADSDTAVFAPVRGSRVMFKNMFAVTRDYEKNPNGGDANGFVFENVDGYKSDFTKL